MLVELRVGEQRYRAVWEVLNGISLSEVVRRFGVLRQNVHRAVSAMSGASANTDGEDSRLAHDQQAMSEPTVGPT